MRNTKDLNYYVDMLALLLESGLSPNFQLCGGETLWSIFARTFLEELKTATESIYSEIRQICVHVCKLLIIHDADMDIGMNSRANKSDQGTKLVPLLLSHLPFQYGNELNDAVLRQRARSRTNEDCGHRIPDWQASRGQFGPNCEVKGIKHPPKFLPGDSNDGIITSNKRSHKPGIYNNNRSPFSNGRSQRHFMNSLSGSLPFQDQPTTQSFAGFRRVGSFLWTTMIQWLNYS
jgi:hypothetical protein